MGVTVGRGEMMNISRTETEIVLILCWLYRIPLLLYPCVFMMVSLNAGSCGEGVSATLVLCSDRPA